MKIYFSGAENLGRPEVVLGNKADVMLTFNDFRKGKPDKRFKKIIKLRRRAAKEKK